MIVRIKKTHENARIPSYAHYTDAGLDLTAAWCEFDENGCEVCHTGLAFEIPSGYVGLVFPRSSVAGMDLDMANCVGVIDSGYRGEVTLKFRVIHFDLESGDYKAGAHVYKAGERVGQIIIMPYPLIELVEVDNLSESDRGVGGYGSMGR